MRVPLLAGNWKMHKTIKESLEFAASFSRLYFEHEAGDAGRPGEEKRSSASIPEVLICPPFTSIPSLSAFFAGTDVSIGAQDLFWEEKGAFTGEISPLMLKDAGAQYVIVGHSERRQYFGETDVTCARKVRAALDHGLKPILCVGETLSEREKGDTLKVIQKMTQEGLSQVKPHEISSVVIAYEPCWAIGTGKEARPEDAAEVITHIRQVLREVFNQNSGDDPGDVVRVLYGGSVNPSNIRGFVLRPEIDGALVGGASLDAEKFYELIVEIRKVRRS